MFGSDNSFYFATIRKITAGFGLLFNDIYITRYSNNGNAGIPLKTLRVPLSYAGSEKWLAHNHQEILPEKSLTNSTPRTRIKQVLPRMSFRMTGMQYDANRKLVTINNVRNLNSLDSDVEILKQLNPVPYDFNFELNIKTKNIDDSLQIIEQILPNFTPSFNLVINDIPSMNITRDVNVVFNSITTTDEFEGALDEPRVIEQTLEFTVKGYLYPAIKDAAIIKRVIANIYNNEDMEDPKTEIITTEVDPYDADYNDDWEAVTTITQDE